MNRRVEISSCLCLFVWVSLYVHMRSLLIPCKCFRVHAPPPPPSPVPLKFRHPRVCMCVAVAHSGTRPAASNPPPSRHPGHPPASRQDHHAAYIINGLSFPAYQCTLHASFCSSKLARIHAMNKLSNLLFFLFFLLLLFIFKKVSLVFFKEGKRQYITDKTKIEQMLKPIWKISRADSSHTTATLIVHK